MRDNEFEAMWAKADAEQDKREELVAALAQADVQAYDALPETDHERDAAHDSGEDVFRRGLLE